MEWTTLFTKTEDISATKAKEYLKTTPQTSFQLVDVRQPKEYQKQHIPGAVLIPLNELKDRIGELTPDLPIIVYCRSGVRSKAGCQILRDDNFTDVLNMVGGILQWNGATAFGGEEFGLDFFLQGICSWLRNSLPLGKRVTTVLPSSCKRCSIHQNRAIIDPNGPNGR